MPLWSPFYRLLLLSTEFFLPSSEYIVKREDQNPWNRVSLWVRLIETGQYRYMYLVCILVGLIPTIRSWSINLSSWQECSDPDLSPVLYIVFFLSEQTNERKLRELVERRYWAANRAKQQVDRKNWTETHVLFTADLSVNFGQNWIELLPAICVKLFSIRML